MPLFCRLISMSVLPVFFLGQLSGQLQPGSFAPARLSAANTAGIKIRKVSIEQTAAGLAVAIASNGALVPAITKLDGPPRLVIDLAGAVNAVPRSRVTGPPGTVKSVRVSQYQQKPPLTRVVIDLLERRDYAWETVQNKLLVHLRPPKSEAEIGGSGPAFTAGIEPTITYAGSAPPGTVQEVDQQLAGPSSVTAAEETTVLNLARGGQIRVCPGTTISVTSSDDRRDVMVGMSTGSFETHYKVLDSEDSVLTPDFRILLPGPGQFELAISADSRGNTCVRSMPGNTGSAVVSELMGEGVYQLKPEERIVFRNGQLAKTDRDVPLDCGCPNPQTQILRAEASPAPPQPSQANGQQPQADMLASNRTDAEEGVAVKMAGTAPEVQRPTPTRRNEVHLQVDAPLVFRGNDPLPAPTEEAQKLPVITTARQELPLVPLPPPRAASSQKDAEAKPKSSFMGRFKHFLSSIFG